MAKIMKPCPDCGGDGDAECYECDGGQVGCDQCDDTGVVGDKECNECEGDGQFPCDECSGSGEVTCEECNGEGEVEIDVPDDTVETNEEEEVLDDPAEGVHPE